MIMTRRRKLFLAGMALVLTVGPLLVTAEEEKPATPPVFLSRDENVEAGSLVQALNREMSHPVLQKRNSRYVLRPGDIVEVDFLLAPACNQVQTAQPDNLGQLGLPLLFGPACNQVQTVQPDGYISLQNVGDMYAAGKTVPELTDALKEKYTKIMRDPLITVVLKDFEHPYFIASGQVAKPGKYELRGVTTVAQAIAIAGGMSDVAKSSHVLLFRRVSDDYINIKQLDLKKMIGQGNLQEDVELQPGDLLFVPKSVTASLIKALFPHTTVGLYFPFNNF